MGVKVSKQLKAIYAGVLATLGAVSTALAAGNNHISWQAGVTIAVTGVTAYGATYGVTNGPDTPAATK